MWVVMARAPADFGAMTRDTRWQLFPRDVEGESWTDNYSNLLEALLRLNQSVVGIDNDKPVEQAATAQCRDLHRQWGVVDPAKLVFLDTLGIALASSTMDFGLMAVNVARKLSGPKASLLIGTSDRVAAANAVMANGTLAHGLDYDDTLEEAIVHTGCCADMTALAVGEEMGASGAAVLEAAIVGTEVLCKVGLVAPGKFHARGFHPTAICSTFGAAAAAGTSAREAATRFKREARE